jgi:uncharacterized membrane protein YfcA
MTASGLVLALIVGVVLGLLGGGGSILAVPIFLYAFHVPAKPAIAMSLAVVGTSAFAGFLTHWRQGSVNLRVALPFGLCAMLSAFATARLTHLVPESLQLGLFAVFAMTAAVLMLRDSWRPPPERATAAAAGRSPTFSALLGLEALGVGALTSLIGAGGGFVIVPALVLLGHLDVKPAVGSALLIITLNALAGFVGYLGSVVIDWPLVLSFTALAAIGAVIGTRLNRRVSQRIIKQGFAVLILVLGAYLILQRVLAP